MTANDFFEVVGNRLRIWANRHCEILRCSKCGREYRSSGKNDPGVCPECLAETHFIGGALDNDDSYKGKAETR